MSQHLRRFLGFALMPVFSLLASLVLLPLVSSAHGAAGFVALAVGQSTGAIVSVIASLAWPVTGGNEVAAASPERRREIFVLSMTSRLLTLVGLLPIAVAFSVLLVDDFRLATSLFMAGIALNGLTAGWYYSGLGEPRRLVINEGVVRLGGYAIAAAALGLGAPLELYALLTVLAGALSMTLNWTHVVGWRLATGFAGWGRTVGTIREHRSGTVSRVLQAAFFYGGPTVYASLAPVGLALYSALDQVQKATANASIPVSQTFVSWVGGSAVEDRARRSRIAFLVVAACGVAVIVVWTALGPLVTDLLFAGEVDVDRLGCLLVGVSVASLMLLKGFELLVMIPMGRSRQVFRIESIGALVGLVLLAGLSATGEPYLAITAWSIVSVALLLVFAVLVRRPDPRAAKVSEAEEMQPPLPANEGMV